MPTDCVASFDTLRVVAKAYLVERQCALDPLRLAEACEALRLLSAGHWEVSGTMMLGSAASWTSDPGRSTRTGCRG